MDIPSTRKVSRIMDDLAPLLHEYRKVQEEYNNSRHLDWTLRPPTPSPKLTGEIRRRSMDLTRALADMRRP